MALYGQMVITDLGRRLYAKAQTGSPLVFTKMGIGSGSYSGDPRSLTELVRPIGYFEINSITATGDTAHVKGVFSNMEITQTTYSCELGLYANDPDYGEILYAYANAGSNGDYIPAIAAGPFSREFQINVVVGSATEVTATIPSTAFVAVSDFDEHVNNKDIHITRGEFEAAISSLRNEVQLIKSTFPDSFTHNLFSKVFTTLDGVVLTRGYFNEAQARLEV
ncbi:hypothetical protein [Brevibacillus thermoruber]|uniref:hypothetical protein n=1 Tax=Brevibacillus thermoruber TaxID=33942 RepID=UPI00068C2CF6|nr:hypothetical protein [Brevibacillus thermoruber]